MQIFLSNFTPFSAFGGTQADISDTENASFESSNESRDDSHIYSHDSCEDTEFRCDSGICVTNQELCLEWNNGMTSEGCPHETPVKVP